MCELSRDCREPGAAGILDQSPLRSVPAREMMRAGAGPAPNPLEPWARQGPRILEERPVIDAVGGRESTRDRRHRPPQARREPYELPQVLDTRRGRFLDVWATGPTLSALHLPRPLGVLLGLALIFLAATVA